MYKKNRPVIVIGILVVVGISCGLVYFLKPVVPVDPKPVTTLSTIQQPTQWTLTSGQETLSLTQLNEKWELKNEQDYPIDQAKTWQLITKWKELKTAGIVQQYPDGKVLEEIFTIQVSDKTGKEESFQFLSGPQDALICKQEGNATTYLVNRQDITGLQIRKEDLLELKQLPILTEEQLQSVTIQQDEQLLLVQKMTIDSEVRWLVSDQVKNQVVSAEAIHELFTTLLNLNINRCLSVTQEEAILQQVGLDQPQAEIMISYTKDQQPEQITLEIGNRLTDINEQVIRFQGSKLIETTDAKSIERLLTTSFESLTK